MMVVLDANILIRAVLGTKVPKLLRDYHHRVEFYTPDSAFREAKDALPLILTGRGIPVGPIMELLVAFSQIIQIIEPATYGAMEAEARLRLDRRDQDDWPILASALVLGCPVWTEDTDFFGCGVATWTSDRIELYFGQSRSQQATATE